MSDNEKTLVREESTVVRTVGGNEEGPVTPEAGGRYAVRSEYGRGGMSRVLLAFDEHIGREIALKELLPERDPDGTPRSSSQSASSRFLREARITGQLDHPNIVPVYELGQHPDGTYYYTQKLVRGVTFKKVLEQAGTAAERLKLLSHFADICHAVAYAHSRGVVHRDLKPENVMVGQFGETVLLDWGLAKARGQKDVRAKEIEKESQLLRSPDATLAGHALGTPSYMSPEQALGNLEEIDERSDVWSLGAILFEILTGRPPFEGETAFSVIDKVIHEEPPRVRRVLHATPPELAAVADKCLSRDKAQRYASAEEVAGEIEAYQSGGNVRAYQYSSWELLRRFVQRNRALSAVSGLALLLLLAGLLAIRDEASRARAALAEAKHNLAQAYLEKAHAAERDSFWHRAEVFYAAARVQEDLPEARWGAAIDWGDLAAVQRIPGASGFISGVAFAPDGKSALAASWGDGTLRRWDVESGRELLRVREEGVLTLAFAQSEDRKRVATTLFRADGSDAVIVRDSTTGTEIFRADPGTPIQDAALSPDGSLLAVATFKGKLLLYQGALRLQESAGDKPVFSPDGKTLASRDGKSLVLRGVPSLEERGRVEADPSALYRPAFSPDGRLLATSGKAGTISFWDAATLAPAGKIEKLAAPLNRLVFSPDGKSIAGSSIEDKTVRVWELSSHGEIAQLLLPRNPFSLAFSNDGDLLAIGERLTPLVLWNFSPRFQGHRDVVWAVAFAPDGKRIASASLDKTIRLWDLQTGKQLWRAETTESVRALSFAARGTRLLCAGESGGKILETATGKLVAELPLAKLKGMAVSPSGDQIAAFGGDTVELAEATTARKLGQIAVPGVGGLAFLDEQKLVAVSQGRLTLWEAPSGKKLASSDVDVAPDQGFSISGDRTRVAAPTLERALVFDARSLRLLLSLHDPGNTIVSTAFRPGGEVIATAGSDGAVRFWDAQGGHLLAGAAAPDVVLTSGLAFSPDGQTLAFLAAGSPNWNNSFHFIQLGHPEKLPPPEEHLARVLAEHGLVLSGMDLDLAAPGAAAPEHEAAMGVLSGPRRAR